MNDDMDMKNQNIDIEKSVKNKKTPQKIGERQIKFIENYLFFFMYCFTSLPKSENSFLR